MSAVPWTSQRLSRASVERYLARLLSLDDDLIGERWGAEHWMLDLPAKWEISRMAVANDTVVAYLAASMKGTLVHCHRIAIARDMQRTGIGTALMREVASAAVVRNAQEFTVKAHKTNTRSVQFLQRVGFHIVGEDSVHFLLAGLTEVIAGGS